MATGTLDQYDNNGGFDQAFGDTTANWTWTAQQIKIGVAGDISDVDLRLKKVGSPTDNVIVEIYSDTGTNRPSAKVSDTQTLAGTSLTTSYSTETFSFFTKPTVAVDDLMHIVIHRSGADDASNYYVLERSNSDTYTNGTFSKSPNGTTWYIGQTGDLYFNEYYTTAAVGGTNLLLMGVG